MERRTYAVIGKNIVKKNTNKIILNHLNITVEKQSIYAVLGKNEAGKSVLLKCLVDVLKLDGGNVQMFDCDLESTGGDVDDGAMIAINPKIGFSPQNFEMMESMEVHQLLSLVGAINGLSKDETVERYKVMATMTHALPEFDHLIGPLSYSQKKILSLVMATIHEPELIILDDITSGMDTKTLKKPSFVLLVCALLLPLIVHVSFATYPQRAVTIAVHNQEAHVTYALDERPECDKYQITNLMSCMFIHHYLNQSFDLVYISRNEYTANRQNGTFNCLMYFKHNYSAALQRRIKRKIENRVDFDNSQIIFTIDTAVAQKAEHVKNVLLEHYKEFLADYAHNKLNYYVPDINYDSLKYNCTKSCIYDNKDKDPIYGKFVNCGLIVILSLFVHMGLSNWLLRTVANDHNRYYNNDGWETYLSHLIVHIPIAAVWNMCIVVILEALYNIKNDYSYIFLCLLFESICGMHFGYIMYIFTHKYLHAAVVIYLVLILCIYESGLWWPVNDLFGLKHIMIVMCLPITAGVNFIRNLNEKKYFDKSLLVICTSTVIIMIITVFLIILTNRKKYKKF